jgi:membrane protease YdiL (CAAX protease family)
MGTIETTQPETKSKIARIPWNPWLGVLYVILVYVASQIAAALLISIYPSLRHWTNAEANDWLSNTIAAQFVYILLAESAAIGLIYVFLRRYKAKFPLIGLKRPRWRDLGFGVMAWVPYIIVFIVAIDLVTRYFPSFNVNQQQQIGFNNVQGAGQMIMAFISLVILPPITEEIMVRGFLYSSLKKAMPTIYAVLLTSALFASAHLDEGGAAGPLWVGALDTFLLSLFLIYLREKTGSLWASITLHALKNGFAFLALFALNVR